MTRKKTIPAPAQPAHSRTAVAPVVATSLRVQGGVGLDQLTDREVCEYVAFVLEGCAHLQGGLGALTVPQLLAFGTRLRNIAGAHGMNVRNSANWAAGPREPVSGVVWSSPSHAHPGDRYEVRPCTEPAPGFNVEILRAGCVYSLIGHASNLEDAIECAMAWEDKGA